MRHDTAVRVRAKKRANQGTRKFISLPDRATEGLLTHAAPNLAISTASRISRVSWSL